jgi:hypothetical protein
LAQSILLYTSEREQVTKSIAVTQQGSDTIFMLGDYQANLLAPNKSKGWRAEYFKKNRLVLTSESPDHPPMLPKLKGRMSAETIVKQVISCLDSGTPLPKASPDPVLMKTKRTRSPKVVTAYQVIDRLLNLLDDNCTVLVPMGKPAALKLSKVRVVDSEGETLCEVPYSIFQGLL